MLKRKSRCPNILITHGELHCVAVERMGKSGAHVLVEVATWPFTMEECVGISRYFRGKHQRLVCYDGNSTTAPPEPLSLYLTCVDRAVMADAPMGKLPYQSSKIKRSGMKLMVEIVAQVHGVPRDWMAIRGG